MGDRNRYVVSAIVIVAIVAFFTILSGFLAQYYNSDDVAFSARPSSSTKGSVGGASEPSDIYECRDLVRYNPGIDPDDFNALPPIPHVPDLIHDSETNNCPRNDPYDSDNDNVDIDWYWLSQAKKCVPWQITTFEKKTPCRIESDNDGNLVSVEGDPAWRKTSLVEYYWAEDSWESSDGSVNFEAVEIGRAVIVYRFVSSCLVACPGCLPSGDPVYSWPLALNENIWASKTYYINTYDGADCRVEGVYYYCDDSDSERRMISNRVCSARTDADRHYVCRRPDDPDDITWPFLQGIESDPDSLYSDADTDPSCSDLDGF